VAMTHLCGRLCFVIIASAQNTAFANFESTENKSQRIERKEQPDEAIEHFIL